MPAARPQPPSATSNPQAASAAGESGPERRALELERSLTESQNKVAALTGELEAARKRCDDLQALLTASKEAVETTAAANEALRAERDAAGEADRAAAAEAGARAAALEKERQELVEERDRLNTVGGGRGGTAALRWRGALQPCLKWSRRLHGTC